MQLTEHIHALKIAFQIPLGTGKTLDRFVYVYLVRGSEICLIDSGVKGSEDIIFNYLNDIGRKPGEISLLLLTHAHPDHIGSARAIKQATGCTVAAHPDAWAWIEDTEMQFRERPVPGFHTLVGGSTSVNRFLQGGEIIDLGPVSLEAIHTPGHANGSLFFYCREGQVLFAGDVIPQTNDMPIYDDAAAVAASINRLKNIQGLAYLLASWMDPVAGSDAYKKMDEGLAYLQHIHTVILDIAAKHAVSAPMELCSHAVKVLGLPEVAVNALIARSFVSHLQIIDRETLRLVKHV